MAQGVPEFRRRVGESERDFLHRVDRETDIVIQQSQWNDKYHCVGICLLCVVKYSDTTSITAYVRYMSVVCGEI